ncbi:unnamed protein product [Thelazia callipaeda]|uniref:Metalloendopeptidase n=1 Tax=Thelazia callipaeda TaxID=103827 RepID=A0A0N5D5R6_THECL|nr:unnamed protein product [Thelazia callipaeda]
MYSALPKGSALRWSKIRDTSGNYVIPYIITGSFDSEEHRIILAAMKAIEKNTCIRFKKRTHQSSFIDLQNKYSEGCYSTVGHFPGRNVVMLEANEVATCIEYDIVLHELLHSVGLWHEHMRHDRDQYIKVHYEMIQPGMYSQFEKISTNLGSTYGIPYNYRSIMHYSKDAFAKWPGAVTMETSDPKFQVFFLTNGKKKF